MSEATYEANTVHGITQPRYVPPRHPEPIQRAVVVGPDERALPPNAAKIARYALTAGWTVRITMAIGYGFDNKTGEVNKKAIKEPTGELTPTGREATKVVGYEMAKAVHSTRVVMLAPDGMMFVGHWAPGWDCGLILQGRTFVENANWSRLEKAVKAHAESAANVRGESRAAGWFADELPLDGDA